MTPDKIIAPSRVVAVSIGANAQWWDCIRGTFRDTGRGTYTWMAGKNYIEVERGTVVGVQWTPENELPETSGVVYNGNTVLVTHEEPS